MAADPPNGAMPRRALLVDWGGVMTSSPFASFSAFCEAEGLDASRLATMFRSDVVARELLIGFEEGRIADAEFELALAQRLGIADAEGLIDRLFENAQPDQAMVDAVRRARAAGIKTGLISNSWGDRYPRDLLAELFDAIVISGEVGVRKPTPRIYELGVEAVGEQPSECVFVDDLHFNLPPAQELGMLTVHHTRADRTIAELRGLLGVAL
jgi:epoxide hydrolase-like predicted phosphatase